MAFRAYAARSLLRLRSLQALGFAALSAQQEESEDQRAARRAWLIHIDRVDDEECERRFRFDKAELVMLVTQLEVPSPLVTTNRLSCSALEALCLFLERMAFPGRLAIIGEQYGRTEDKAFRIFNAVLDPMSNRWGHLLQINPNNVTDEQLKRLAEAVTAKGAPVMHCFGFLDGTLRGIARPSQNQGAAYNGHKRKHGLKYQALTAPNGMIADMWGPMAGARHDASMLRQSELLDRLRALPTDSSTSPPSCYFVYSDPAYPKSDVILPPHRGTVLGAEEQADNTAMAAVRIEVEHGFALILQHWAYSAYSSQQKTLLQPVATIYLMSVLLTNIRTCLRGNQISTKFSLQPPSLQSYLSGYVFME
jgi:hypothetical protein